MPDSTFIEKPLFDPNFLDKLPVGLFILRNNEIIYANRKFRKDLHLPMTGDFPITELLPFFSPEDQDKLRNVLSKSSLLPSVSEWQSFYGTGLSTWIQLRVAQLDSEHNLVVVRDIGKLKQLLEEKTEQEIQFKALIERTPNFMFIFKNGMIEYFNHAFIKKLGYSREEIEERKNMPTFLVVPEYREKVARILLESRRQLAKGKIKHDPQRRLMFPEQTSEFELLCKDGSRIPVYAIVQTFYSGKNVYVQGVLIDLSEIKQVQQMKFDFLTLAQHHLRTPIANMKGHLDFYRKKINIGVNAEEKVTLESNLIEVMERNLERMISLTQDLNDVALIRSGKLQCHLRGEDFIPILQQVLSDLDYLLRQYRVNIVVEYPAVPYIVNLDRNRISQALRNILDNAIRFTGHGMIEIKVSASSEELVIEIRDTGVGIDPQYIEDIGKPFMTFHKSSSGLGLGLYLTREIITDHDGKLEISSAGFQKGTKVTIRLPLLVSPIKSVQIKLPGDDDWNIDDVIKQATTAENLLLRMEAINQLRNYAEYTEFDKEKILAALEKCILYDKDGTLRNLASRFYSEIADEKDN